LLLPALSEKVALAKRKKEGEHATIVPKCTRRAKVRVSEKGEDENKVLTTLRKVKKHGGGGGNGIISDTKDDEIELQKNRNIREDLGEGSQAGYPARTFTLLPEKRGRKILTKKGDSARKKRSGDGLERKANSIAP